MNSPLRHYSNEITSGVLHLVGAVSAIALLVVMIVFASLYGSAWHIVGYTIYGTFMTLLYLSSTIYHLIPYQKIKAKEVFQRIDHAMIYLFIAATYTPICFIALFGIDRWFVFFLLWVIALIGAIIKLCNIKVYKFIPVTIYLSMGWTIIFYIGDLIKVMNESAILFLVLGGVSYSLGVIFFVFEFFLKQRKYFWMHEIFHLFVLGGTTFHTLVMFYLL